MTHVNQSTLLASLEATKRHTSAGQYLIMLYIKMGVFTGGKVSIRCYEKF